MMCFFPSANIITCSRHLRKNVTQKLDDMLGKKTAERQLLQAAVDSLMDCSDMPSFDARLEQMTNSELRTSPTNFTN